MPSTSDPAAPSSIANAFVLVCSEKSTRESADFKLERAFQCLALKKQLDALQQGLPEAQAAYLPGAGAAYQAGCAHAIVDGRWLAVFVGCVSPRWQDNQVVQAQDVSLVLACTRSKVQSFTPSMCSVMCASINSQLLANSLPVVQGY
jgi:hypothetical protein